MSNQKAVIFDWGGVLMRTTDLSPRLYWDQELGLAPGTVESIVHGISAWKQAQRGQITLEAYWQQVGNELKIPPSRLMELREDFYRGDQLDTDLIELIKEIRADEVRVGLLSNNSLDLIDVLDELGIARLFDAIVISAQIGIMKPDKRAYKAILDALDAEPSRSIFIDDFVQNVEGARRIGMSAVRFSSDCNLKKRVKQWLGKLD